MICCTFAGHRNVFHKGIEMQINANLEMLADQDRDFCFYCGGMGDFDILCARSVKRLKSQYPENNIKLCLVIPYMMRRINVQGKYLLETYDEIIIPDEIAGLHYKRAIEVRNRWMVDHSDYLVFHITHKNGGAWKTVCYAANKGLILLACN